MTKIEFEDGAVGEYADTCPRCGGADFRWNDEGGNRIKVCVNPDCTGGRQLDPFEG